MDCAIDVFVKDLMVKLPLYVSIAVIIAYWIYQLLNSNHVMPSEFSQLAKQIVRVKIIHLTAILLLLRFEGAGLRALGFTAKRWPRQLLMGLLFGTVMFFLFNASLNSVMGSLFPKPPASGVPLLSYFSDIGNLYTWLLIGIFGGGLVEELMRVFVLTRFQKAFGSTGLYFALVSSSFIFGLGHLYQGIGSAITTGISGLILGIIFIRRRSAIELIITHAVSDVLSILAAYQLAGHG